MNSTAPATDAMPLLQARGIRVRHRRRGWLWSAAKYLTAVDGVDVDIAAGESLGLVGETGCGKSTLGRAIVRLIRPNEGTIHLGGDDMLALRGAESRAAMRRAQMVFQDPWGSLNPRRSIAFAVTEPLLVHNIARAGRAKTMAAEALEWVGLPASALQKYPHQLSGGQRQRVGIARAAILRPQLIVADEPVSALDMSVQARVLNHMRDLQQRLGMSYLFISHDLSVVAHMCERTAVMHRGKIVEQAPREKIFSAAAHPYTRRLLASALPPKTGVKLPPPESAVEESSDGGGCNYAGRCPHATELCRRERPVMRNLAADHLVACHHAESIVATSPAGRAQ